MSTLDQMNAMKIPEYKAMKLKGHSSRINECNWNPDDDILATCSTDQSIILWDLNDINILKQSYRSFYSILANDAEIPAFTDKSAMDWKPDGSVIATGNDNGIIELWDKNGIQLHHLDAPPKSIIIHLKWNKSGTNILVNCGRKFVVIDVLNKKCMNDLKCRTDIMMDIDWKSDDTFASCSFDRHIYVWQIGKQYPIKRFRENSSFARKIKWNGYEGDLLAAYSNDNTIRIWSVNHIRPVGSIKNCVNLLEWIPSSDGHPSSTLTFCSRHDNSIYFLDIERNIYLHRLNKYMESISSISFRPDGKYMASVSSNHQLFIWCTTSGKLCKTYHYDEDCIQYCKWNSNGTKLALGTENGYVIVLDVRNI